MLLLCLFLTFSAVVAVEVLSPSELQGQFQSAVFGKFFGPQSGINITADATLLTLDICDPQVREQNFTGRIVVFQREEESNPCSFEDRYHYFEATNALGMLESWKIVGKQDVPGLNYNVHGGGRGKSTKTGTLPWLQVNQFEFEPVRAALKSGRRVTLRLEVTDTSWEDLFASGSYIGLLRVLLALLNIGGGVFGLTTLHSLHPLPGRQLARVSVLIETICLFVLGIVLALSGIYGSDLLPFPVVAFFGTGLPGLSYFTTFLVAMHWRNIQQSTHAMERTRNVFRTHKFSLSLSFCLFVGIEWTISCLIASYHNTTVLIFFGVALFVTANLVTLLFFAFQVLQFQRMLKQRTGTMRGLNTTSTVYEDMQRHMSKWLVATSVFMLLTVISYCCFLFSFAWTPRGLLACFILLFFSRWGTAVTQIVAWDVPARARRESDKKKSSGRQSVSNNVNVDSAMEMADAACEMADDQYDRNATTPAVEEPV